MPTKQKSNEGNTGNPNIPTLYIDSGNIYQRKDGMYFIRFIADIPEGEFEQTKIMMKKQNLHGLIDDLCEITNHYPEKKADTKKVKTRKEP